ncbi:MAG: carboxypeptidase-like regulatory domain-containing protein [Fuerstiella sp.]
MHTSLGTWLSALAVLGMAYPAHAGNTTVTPPARTSVTDVALTAQGDLAGQVIRTDGRPAAGVPVQILHQQQVVAEVQTDSAGRYTVRGLRNGIHLVKSVNSQTVCRFWPAASAPPAARQALLLTADDTIVRGQSYYCDDGCGQSCGEGCGTCRGGLFSGTNPGTAVGVALFAGAIVAVAVSVDDNTNPAAVVPASP